MTRCCVPKCCENGTHQFPNNEKVRKMWLKAIRRPKLDVSKHTRLCSKHFQNTDYLATSDHTGTPELSKKCIQLRFKYDRLFKTRKQAWTQFHAILCKKYNFPKEMNVDQVRKKWSYNYDSFRIAKKIKNKKWKYYKMFDKHFGKAKILDKFDSWNDEWRSRLIIAVVEATALKLDPINMWRTVERSLRSQELPLDCCIQDIKNLWHHIKMTFGRKYRMHLRQKTDPNWPHFDALYSYYEAFEKDVLLLFATEGCQTTRRAGPAGDEAEVSEDGETEFQWTRDITESFIQVKLQNEEFMRENKWHWGPLRNKMVKEYGFPKCLTSREISRKWSSTFKEYQKAVASKNTSWVYYKLFDCYLGDGNFSLNPLLGWQPEYIFLLIRSRSELESLFKLQSRSLSFNPWSEVEKQLRLAGLPLANSLLDLPKVWAHLLSTYNWKKKFAAKGILSEEWPYFDAMKQYMDSRTKKLPPQLAYLKKPRHSEDSDHAAYDDNGNDAMDDEYEDDIKLFDLKQKMKPKVEVEVEVEARGCRSCGAEEGCVGVFEARDDAGLHVAHKLRAVCGVQVEETDNLPKLICLSCIRDLESAYVFRERCRQTDQQLRTNSFVNKDEGNNNTRIEIKQELDESKNVSQYPKDEETDEIPLDYEYLDFNDDLSDADDYLPPKRTHNRKRTVKKIKIQIQRPKKKKKKTEYIYKQVCEVCGKHTKNLQAHMDVHSSEKAYECGVCQKRFKFKSGLFIHKAIHDPQPKKTCEICGKTFHILAQYKRHFVYHANERKFACETCGKRFNTMDILKVHMRMHTDERPFTCEDCGKTFRTAGCVSRHRRIVHKKKRSVISISNSVVTDSLE